MITETLMTFVIGFEGFVSCAKPDGSQWSNGFGTKARSRWECIDEVEAKRRMKSHMELDSKHVKLIFKNVKQHEHDSLVSYCYNMGRGGCADAVKLAAQGRKDAAAWVMKQHVKKGSGQEEGLTRRRLAEIAMLTKPEVRKTCIYQEYS